MRLLSPSRATALNGPAKRIIATGNALPARSITRRLIERFVDAQPRHPTGTTKLTSLTDRELEVPVLT